MTTPRVNNIVSQLDVSIGKFDVMIQLLEDFKTEIIKRNTCSTNDIRALGQRISMLLDGPLINITDPDRARHFNN